MDVFIFKENQYAIKGIRGSRAFFILFNLVLTKLQDAFYRFYKFKIVFEIYPDKVGGYNRYLMGGAN